MTAHCPHCGVVLGPPLTKPRSLPQLRRYFALIRAAFTHWPEAHERQFASETECRKFLQVKAGYRCVGASLPLTGISKERAMLLAEAAIRGADAYAEVAIHGDTLVVLKPYSISFARMGHQTMTELVAAVEAVIETETGVNADVLLKENERAA